MSTYFIIKWIHILSSVVMVGTGFGSALYMFCANHFGSLEAKRFVSYMVVKVDWIFTLPSVIVQPLSGFWLMSLTGWSFTTPWIQLAIGLYCLVGACWLPVVWLQILMQRMTQASSINAQPLPSAYRTVQRWWEALGYVGFSGAISIFYLMAVKPPLWG